MGDLNGKTMVITGASDGIGAYATEALAKRGADVAVIGRSPEKTRRVADAAGAEAFICDFSQLDQVKQLAENLLARYPQIDVLVNNAGLLGTDQRTETADGHETTFQVNHLAPFLLTRLLQERLQASHSKIINTSSIGNNMGKVNLEDLDSRQNYRAMQVYGTTKLQNILFTKALAQRWSGIQTAAFHPGVVATHFGHDASPWVRMLYHTFLKDWFLISPAKGCETLFWLIDGQVGKDWVSGGYYDKKRPGRMNKQASDLVLADALWQCSEMMVQPWL